MLQYIMLHPFFFWFTPHVTSCYLKQFSKWCQYQSLLTQDLQADGGPGIWKIDRSNVLENEAIWRFYKHVYIYIYICLYIYNIYIYIYIKT